MLIVLKHFSWLLYFLYQLSGQEGLHRDKICKTKTKGIKLKILSHEACKIAQTEIVYTVSQGQSPNGDCMGAYKSRRICFNHNTVDTKTIIILSKRNAGGHMEQRLRECPRETCLTGKPSYGQAPIHDIIMDTLLCSHK